MPIFILNGLVVLATLVQIIPADFVSWQSNGSSHGHVEAELTLPTHAVEHWVEAPANVAWLCKPNSCAYERVPVGTTTTATPLRVAHGKLFRTFDVDLCNLTTLSELNVRLQI